MRPLEAIYELQRKVALEIDAIQEEDSARVTFIGDEAFNHEEWLDAEAQALEEERQRRVQTLNSNGRFVGLS